MLPGARLRILFPGRVLAKCQDFEPACNQAVDERCHRVPELARPGHFDLGAVFAFDAPGVAAINGNDVDLTIDVGRVGRVAPDGVIVVRIERLGIGIVPLDVIETFCLQYAGYAGKNRDATSGTKLIEKGW